MSDYENSAPVDDELSLPRATVYKLIGEMLPKEISCTKETRDMLIDCCNESNEVCEKDSKKTIAPEHVLTALQDLGFEKYINEVREAYDEHRQQQTKDRSKRSAKQKKSGMTDEELKKAQEELFSQARQQFQSEMANQNPPQQ